MVANVTGKPVQHENFYDREREVQKLWQHLANDDVLLLAPRRVGKTSVMYRLREGAPERGVVASYLSVADADSEIGFVRQLLDAVIAIEPAKVRVEKLADSGLGRFFQRITKVGVLGVSVELQDSVASHWREAGEALISVLAETSQSTLLLIDELPVFVLALARQDPSGARAADFLGWLRKLREAQATTERVRWLLAGSIGLDTVARRLRLSKTIGDLYVYSTLGPFARETALSFLEELAQSHMVPLSDEVKQHLCDRLDWLLPYHLQLAFSELRDHVGDHQCTATVEVIDEVYEKMLAKRPYFDHWEQRLHDELGQPDSRHAVELLNAAARDPNGASIATLQATLAKHFQDPEQRDEHLTYLIDVLRGDGYLTPDGERLRFCSPLLRDYWSRRIAPRRAVAAAADEPKP
ncbi:MAG: hypothetical protein R3B70_15440 [Polyangiaceae bacterium]